MVFVTQLPQHLPSEVLGLINNYVIHKSAVTKAWLAQFGARIQLHFLPPYCPDHNRIERLWLDVHANVTRNHTCKDMAELMRRVANYLNARNRRKCNEKRKAA